MGRGCYSLLFSANLARARRGVLDTSVHHLAVDSLDSCVHPRLSSFKRVTWPSDWHRNRKLGEGHAAKAARTASWSCRRIVALRSNAPRKEPEPAIYRSEGELDSGSLCSRMRAAKVATCVSAARITG
jgi:hypothetical protein